MKGGPDERRLLRLLRLRHGLLLRPLGPAGAYDPPARVRRNQGMTAAVKALSVWSPLPVHITCAFASVDATAM
jgi:hypothetical protein